jgi:hypothetical protein
MDVLQPRCVASGVCRFQVNHLPSHHASYRPDGMGKFMNDLQSALCIPIARGSDGFKGQCQQGIAGKNRSGLAENHVRRGLAAPKVVVVESG